MAADRPAEDIPDPELPAPAKLCRACSGPVRDSARFCPVCGASQDPVGDIRLRRKEEADRWRTIRRAIVFYAVYLSTIVPLFWLPESVKATAMIVISLVDAVIILVYRRISRVSLRPLLTFGSSSPHYLFVGIGLLVPLMAVNFVYHGMLRAWFEVEESSLSDIFMAGGYGTSVIVFTICVMPAIWEEIAFRGLLQTRLAAIVGKREALLLSAILFAAIHVVVFSWPYLFLVGLLLGFLRQRTGSLIPGMGVHFLHNLVVVAVELNLWGLHV